jgi:hypothetical protein
VLLCRSKVRVVVNLYLGLISVLSVAPWLLYRGTRDLDLNSPRCFDEQSGRLRSSSAFAFYWVSAAGTEM